MTPALTIAGIERTMVSDKMADELAAETPRSALLEESLVEQPFAMFFASTWAEQGPWRDERALQKPNTDFWLTPVLSDESVRRVSRWRPREEPAEQEPGIKANSDRVVLLARRYVAKAKFSAEESARLAIVTERVRQLVPAVTSSEFELLEHVLNVVREIGESDTDIRQKLGIAHRKNG